MPRRATPLVCLACLAVAALAGCGGGHVQPPVHDLTGTWTNSAGVGTTIVITQHGAQVTWVGGPNDKAWVQFFNGKIVGNDFSGTFAQDAPGVVPQRFHGTMDAQINDACHFTFTKVAQHGEPTLTNVVYTKSSCGAQPALTVSLAQAQFIPKVPSGGRITFCNDGTITHVLSSKAAQNRLGVTLKRSTCITRRFVNSTKAPIEVVVRATPGGHAVFHVVVEPSAS